jgi:rod shape-determining protein MreC
LPVQINRTGLRTVAFGVGDTAHLSMPAVPREADVRVGDLVVTSGLGGRFPSGYPVAIVASVDRREGLTFAQVWATPVAALDRGREVLLLKPAAPDQATPDQAAPDPTTPGPAAAEAAPAANE